MRRLILIAALVVGLAAPTGADIDGDTPVDERGGFARREWAPFAERGAAEARIGLAALDRRGAGAAESRDEAKARYRHAAHQGDARFHLDAIEREPPPAESEAATTGPATSSPASAEPAGSAQTAPGGGRFGVQLGAFRRRDRADKAWEQLRAAHPGLLGGLGSSIILIDLGAAAAAVYRLVAGAFETKAAAQELCARLRQRDVDCFVPRP